MMKLSAAALLIVTAQAFAPQPFGVHRSTGLQAEIRGPTEKVGLHTAPRLAISRTLTSHHRSCSMEQHHSQLAGREASLRMGRYHGARRCRRGCQAIAYVG